jgi:glycosyltransferase involved in cell wall biosynthesis
MPFFSIITPTIQRPSLNRTCGSLEYQEFKDWEHLVQVDSDTPNRALLYPLISAKRSITMCGRRHQNGGNTCRNHAWLRANGNYLFYLDDDNYLSDPQSLTRVYRSLLEEGFPPVAFFPITRFGGRFFPPSPPRTCYVDTMNVVVQREIGRWPDISTYESDGVFVEALVRDNSYHMFPDVDPIATMPSQGRCQ